MAIWLQKEHAFPEDTCCPRNLYFLTFTYVSVWPAPWVVETPLFFPFILIVQSSDSHFIYLIYLNIYSSRKTNKRFMLRLSKIQATFHVVSIPWASKVLIGKLWDILRANRNHRASGSNNVANFILIFIMLPKLFCIVEVDNSKLKILWVIHDSNCFTQPELVFPFGRDS